jgi:type IV secretion system protein VirB10
MSDTPAPTPTPEDDFDPHRFAVEPKKKTDKKFLSIVSTLGFVGLVIAGSIWFGKMQLMSFFEDLKKDRESAPAQETMKPEKATARTAFELPKFEVQEESNNSATVSKDTGDLAAGRPVAAQPENVEQAIPVINDRKGASSTRGDVPAIGKNTDPGEGTQGAKAEIAMMLESVPASKKKQDHRDVKQSERSPLPVQDTSGISAAPVDVDRPRTVEAMAAEKAEKSAISATAQSTSANVGDRSRVILRGSYIECVLESQLVSNIPGITACIVPTNVYSDNGKRMLIKKGSKLVGEYSATVKLGDSRFGVMWQRIKTPEGVVIDVDSGAADNLGTMGLSGVFDSHWAERLGTAFMFSIIADGISTQIEPRATGTTGTTGTTTVQPSATVDTAQAFAKAQIQAAMAISPTFFKNRGDRVSVFVNRDLWFR